MFRSAQPESKPTGGSPCRVKYDQVCWPLSVWTEKCVGSVVLTCPKEVFGMVLTSYAPVSGLRNRTAAALVARRPRAL